MKRMWMVILTGYIVGLCLSGIYLSVDAMKPDILNYEEYIEEVCESYNICPELVQAIIERESSWNPKAENDGCIGLMQIDPNFHRDRMERLGITDLKSPYDNILVGVDYLAELFEQHEDVYAVLMTYNAGYSKNYGMGAWMDGNYSDYAMQIAERAAELERGNGK